MGVHFVGIQPYILRKFIENCQNWSNLYFTLQISVDAIIIFMLQVIKYEYEYVYCSVSKVTLARHTLTFKKKNELTNLSQQSIIIIFFFFFFFRCIHHLCLYSIHIDIQHKNHQLVSQFLSIYRTYETLI